MKKKHDSTAWFTAAQVCGFTGVSRGNLNRDVLAYLPAEAVDRNASGHLRIHGPSVLAMLIDREIMRRGHDDLTGSDSPALERGRAARADLAELEVKRRRGELVEIDKVWSQLHTIRAIHRQAAVQLRRHHGDDALEIVNSAWADSERALQQQQVEDHEHEHE